MSNDDREQQVFEAMLGEQPRSLPADLDDEELRLAQTAALLKAARPGGLQPDPAFVADLRGRLFGAGAQGQPSAPPAAEPSRPGIPERATKRTPAGHLSRRRLLGALAGGAVAGVAVGNPLGRAAAEADANARVRHAEQQLAETREQAAGPYQVPLIGSLGEWVTVAEDELAPGEVRRFEAGALIGYLLRHGDGGYRAFSASCTHMGCLVSWQAATRRLLCPCHGAAYDEQGATVSGIARHPLPRIEVRVEGAHVQIWTISPAAHGSGVPTYTRE